MSGAIMAMALLGAFRMQVRHDHVTSLHRDIRLLGMIVAIALAIGTAADAMPLSLYRYEAQAQAHCPGDSVVWLDLRKGVYYLKRHKRFGLGVSGLFVCRQEASSSGYRRSLLGRR